MSAQLPKPPSGVTIDQLQAKQVIMTNPVRHTQSNVSEPTQDTSGSGAPT